ncbi:DUF4402 domain-containing protein [Sphingomonas glacialis]|uniref:DUF4402 domain-containing protein n=1 Tax=Sphingomonas glacialis TaxID=658225 RepID=A0A502G503_9SPHN|nr:DUF4402 domain-containing protein [Sphingomonas glacialis]TPG56490.1 DUF4402 domain-containing protein [Sphingomonas glacialis]
MKLFPHLLAGVTAVSMASGVSAAPGAARASVQILRPVAVTKTADLMFGTVLPATSTATVAIRQDGVRTCGSPLRCYGTPSAGRFHVVGVSGQIVCISLATTRVTLTDGAAHTMTANLSLSTSSLALAGGSGDFGIAGVLSVKANQAEGAYAGQYVVSVDYQ